jgi:hypothetical protein
MGGAAQRCASVPNVLRHLSRCLSVAQRHFAVPAFSGFILLSFDPENGKIIVLWEGAWLKRVSTQTQTQPLHKTTPSCVRPVFGSTKAFVISVVAGAKRFAHAD